MKDITFTLPISKIDEEQRIVYGIATTEQLDKQNEIVDYEASKKAFGDWVGNIREMHRPDSAVGKAIDIQFDDDKKQVMIGAYISKSPDGENAWTKIKENILTGFSIGGKVFKTVEETVKSDSGDVAAKRISDYELSETSLVDNPANPDAKFIMVKSANGHLDQVEEMVDKPKISEPYWLKSFNFSIDQNNQLLNKADNEGDMEKKDYSTKERKQMADSGEALPDGSFPIKNKTDLKNAIQSIGRAKDEAKAKTHIKARAKDLGATDMIPDTWKASKPEMKKADESKEEVEDEQVASDDKSGNQDEDKSETEGETPQGAPDERSDEAEAEPEAEEETPPTSSDESGDSEQDQPLANGTEAPQKVEEKSDKPQMAKSEVRKGLYEVGSLADAIAMIACIKDWCVMEAEYEQDGSDIPTRLTEAIDNLGGILADMAKEEATEAAGAEEELELANQPDMTKAIEEATAKALDNAVKSFGDKVEALVKPLADRVATLEHQPASVDRPKASFVEIDKGVGTTPDRSDADRARWEDLKKVATERKDDPSFTRSQRTALVDEMWALNKRINHTRTQDLHPEIKAEFPQAFSN